MSSPELVRALPPKWQLDVQLAKQQDRCFYCDIQFGNYVTRDGKPIKLKINWDHFVPWVYSQNNENRNFVAACHVCNGIKSDQCFGSVDEAKSYIASKRAAKGYV